MSKKLRECPFCNGTHTISVLNFFTGDSYRKCDICGAEAPEAKTPEEAIRYWNTRPAENALKAENERLKEKLELVKEHLVVHRDRSIQSSRQSGKVYHAMNEFLTRFCNGLIELINTDNEERGERTMNKKCSLCGEVLPDYCISDVEISYKVNGQTVLNRRRKICGHCQSITVQEITSSDFFPDKWDRQCHLIPYDGKLGKHCPDCAVQKGEFHKNGCDWEKCPICGLQLLSCGHGDQVPLPPEKGGENE